MGRAAPRSKDEGVTRIFPREDTREDNAVRQLGLEVLEAVNSAVDAVVEQRLVDFLGKQSLAADVRQSGVRVVVA